MAFNASTIATIVTGIQTTIQTVPGVTFYGYEPQTIDALPAVTLFLPSFERRHPEDGESELGFLDLDLNWPLRIYYSLDDPSVAFAGLAAVLGQVIAAVDAHPNLFVSDSNVRVVDAVIADGQAGTTAQDNTRQMLVYECSLLALAQTLSPL